VFYTVPDSNFVQIWAPMIRDSSLANGTIEICRGSHREGIARASWNESPSRALQVLVDDDLVAKYERLALPMRLGQLLIFSGRTFHRSGRNRSGNVRYSMIGMFHDVDHAGFGPASIQFGWKGKQPVEYFREEMARLTR
jgi:ectoine hydroxylase-related dioxygenase (phytanoyl-CoA dioxygenase family)